MPQLGHSRQVSRGSQKEEEATPASLVAKSLGCSAQSPVSFPFLSESDGLQALPARCGRRSRPTGTPVSRLCGTLSRVHWSYMCREIDEPFIVQEARPVPVSCPPSRRPPRGLSPCSRHELTSARRGQLPTLSTGTRFWVMVLNPLQRHLALAGDEQLARVANLSHVSVAFVAGRLETDPDVSVAATKTASWHGCRGRALVAV